MLLLPTRDPDRPERLPWLELPGGGIEPGEDVVAAARRELGEELGWDPGRAALVPAGWTRSVVYPRRDGWVRQDEQILRCSADPPPSFSVAGRTAEELDAHGEPAWVAVADLLTSSARFFPASLPDLLLHVLDGGSVVEPLSRFW